MLAGGRSSEHERVAATRRRRCATALRRGGPRGRRVRLARDGAWRRDGGGAGAARPAAGCWRATSRSRCCTGRSARTGRSRACSSCSTSPYVGAGVLAVVAVHGQGRLQGGDGGGRGAAGRLPGGAGAASAAAARCRRLAALGLPVFVKPARLGSSVGISKVASADELDGGAGDRVRARRAARSSRRPRRASRSSARCRATATPEASLPGEIVLQRRRLVRLRGEVHAGRDGAGGPGADADAVRRARCASWRVETFVRVGCAGWRGSTSSSSGDGCCVNELNTMPGFTATSVLPEDVGGQRRAYPEVCDRLLALGLERHRAERARGDAF